MSPKLHSRRNAALATLAWVLAAMCLDPAGAHAKLYFSAFLATGGTGIERAGLQGGGIETLQSELSGFEDGLALDAAHGRLYFTDTNASVIQSASLNGSDAQIVLDDFGQEPLGIALDVEHQKMYWTDREGVKRANLNGAEVELLSSEHARGFIALDLLARQMYWADWPSGTIETAAMTPGAMVTDLVSKQVAPFGVAVDPIGGRVYWLQVDLGKKKKEKDAIRSANLAGGEIRTLLERPAAGFEGGLAIEPSAGKLYWTEAEAHDIGVANLDGSGARTLLSTGEDTPEGLAVTAAEPHPTLVAVPVIEGTAQVGSTLSCNPGTWTGIGPLSFSYQWEIAEATTAEGAAANVGAIEGATGSAFVPSSEQAGASIVCEVTAADSVATTSAQSAAVSVAPFPAAAPGAVAAPAPIVIETALLAGIAISHLTVAATTARVPVFSTLAGMATLTAHPARASSPPARSRSTPGRSRSTPRRSRSTRVRPRRAGSGRSAGTARAGHTQGSDPRSARASGPRTITVSEPIGPGRSLITLAKLVRGTTYRLVLTIASADGQATTDTATLVVSAR